MPELPEVEQFRQILLPLASLNNPISLQLVKDNPPRKWLNVDEVRALSNRFICSSVLRKGKLLCMVLQKLGSARKAPVECCKYLYLHMGMTGRLSAPNRRCRLENVQDDGSAFPPSHTYLLLESSDYKVAFSDPRKFGSAHLSDDLSSFDALAPDALHALQERDNSSLWSESILPKLIHQSTGIKALLLDQKRALSGVGNWVADEVMYQVAMHPDQSHLTEVQARELCDRLFDILSTAVERLKHDQEFPEEWLFGYRWTNKKAGIDAQGRPLKFIVRFNESPRDSHTVSVSHCFLICSRL